MRRVRVAPLTAALYVTVASVVRRLFEVRSNVCVTREHVRLYNTAAIVDKCKEMNPCV